MINAQTRRLQYLFCDLVATEIAVLLFDIYRYFVHESVNHAYVSLEQYLCYRMLLLSQICIPLMMMGLYYLSGYYNKIFVKSRISEIITTIKTAFFGTLIVFFVQLINDLSSDRVHDYMLFIVLFALLFVLVYLPRVVITSRSLKLVRTEKLSFPALMVGFASVPNLRDKLVSIQHTTGIRAVAYIDGSKTGEFCIDGCRKVQAHDIITQVRALDVKNVVIFQHPEGMEAVLPIIYRLLPEDVAVYILPPESDMIMSRMRQSDVTGEPLMEVSCTQMPQSTLNIKRVSDVAFGMLALLVLAIPMGVIALIVKADSTGPVIYRQRRIGFRRKPFNIFKFRTMRMDAESEGTPRLSSENDSRITRVGRILRKYRLDEIPQFFNVVRGDMSIVGPRPEREYFIKQIMDRAPYYTLLHQVRPGITSWGMVKYGYATSVEQMVERMRYDLLYIENISFAVDMKIILHTAVTVISGKGL
ncbi:MAG: sugar transferase [Paramuribaculum sp.]|nr:sugar transferase [Paramuribaculum sp.]